MKTFTSRGNEREGLRFLQRASDSADTRSHIEDIRNYCRLVFEPLENISERSQDEQSDEMPVHDEDKEA